MSELKDLMKKKLGFGCMRLPVLDGEQDKIDDQTFCEMIDSYMEQGFQYFDTAYPYHKEQSEEAVRRCLVERYDRDRFFLADKMPVWLVKSETDYEPIFQRQLERCGVDYFDFYLLHALDKERILTIEANGGFEFAKKIKADGRAKHIGFSFHDSADVLDETLSRHPEIEFVQLQINYYDWESDIVQSRKCYETAVKYGIPVIVMEPVKGGTLANLIGRSAEVLKELDEQASFASYAIRFAASLDQVMLVLSGMSTKEQLADNTSYMKDFVPLSDKEKHAIVRVREELDKLPTIPCTSCQYCVDGCPKKIVIPEVFSAYNMSVQFGVNAISRGKYHNAVTDHGKASDCIRCGKCEGHCPQHLPIRDLLVDAVRTFEP